MGWGDFGSNGSVHWQINYDDAGEPDHLDYDDTKAHPQKPGINPTDPQIGDGKAGRGRFRVTLRFQSRGAASQALNDALKELGPGGTAIIEVPIRAYRGRPDPKNRDEWEIGVDW